MDEEKKKQEIALFRYGLISPVLHGNAGMQIKYLRKIAEKQYDVPHMGTKRYKTETIRHWLKNYRKGGFDALKPKGRIDKGQSRKIESKLAEDIKDALSAHPYLSGSALYRLLIAEGKILVGGINEGTLRKFIKDNKLREQSVPTARKKFEKKHVNELWTADAMHGPYIKIPRYSGKHKTFLIAAIDDHSRIITARQWVLYENTILFGQILKNGIQRFGLPRALYCDNGSLFSSSYLQLSCARLGIALIHSKPYDSPSRGKIERFFRTVRQKFLPLIDLEEITHINQLNERFEKWLDKEYHKHIHTGINQTPMDRFIGDLKQINIKRTSTEQLDRVFQITVHRKVKNDATVSIKSILYECPPEWIGKKIEIRYSWDKPDDLLIYQDDQPVAKLQKLNPHENANIPAWGIKFTGIKEDKKNG
jgi:transposase InsO family protein